MDHVDTSTGVSAADRARTVRELANAALAPTDLRRPGHVFPLRVKPGGVLKRGGHTEAAVDLLVLAGLSPVGVIGEITADDGSMRVGDDLADFAAQHGLLTLTIAELVQYRGASERQVEHVATSHMPTRFGEFRAFAYRSVVDETEHLALTMGDVSAAGRSHAGG